VKRFGHQSESCVHLGILALPDGFACGDGFGAKTERLATGEERGGRLRCALVWRWSLVVEDFDGTLKNGLLASPSKRARGKRVLCHGLASFVALRGYYRAHVENA